MLGVDLIPGLEWVTLVRVNLEGMVNLLHSLFSVRVELYSTIQRLLSCQGNLTAKGLLLVVEIHHKTFVARRFVHAVPQLDHITHLVGISPPD